MANKTITSDTDMESLIATGLLSGENITINSGAKLTCTETPSVLIGSITINQGELHIDGTNISSDNVINFVGEGGLINGSNDQTITVNGQGKLNITGDWFDIGTTDGTDNQVIDLSTATGVGYWEKGGVDFCVDAIPMIQVETGRLISFSGMGAVGTFPSIGDWVHKQSDKTIMGKIKEIDTDNYTVTVWGLTGSFTSGDVLEVTKVVDNVGPDMQVSFTANIDADDVKADGVYMEFGNSRAQGADYMTNFGTGLGGLVFHHAFQGTDLTLGGATGGFKAPSGCNIRVPNVIVNTSSLVGEGGTGTPYADGDAFGCATNTNETEWYALEFSSGGEIYMSTCNWGNAYTQDSGASKFDVEYSGFVVGVGCNIGGSKTTFDHVLVCQATEVNALSGLVPFGGVQDTVNGSDITFCTNVAPRIANRNVFGGITSLNVSVSDCIFTSANGGSATSLNACYGYSFVTVTNGLAKNNMYFGNNDVEQDYMLNVSTSSVIVVEDMMVSCTQEQTPQTIDKDMIRVTNSSDISFVGIQFIGTGVTGGEVFYMTDVSDIKIRAIGMIDDRIDLGTMGRSVVTASGLCNGIDVARCWFDKTTTITEEFIVVPTTAKNVIVQNCSSKYLAEVQISGTDTKFKGISGGPGAVSSTTGWEDALVGSYGRSIHDAFESDTTGTVACVMITPSPDINDTTITAGNPLFYKDGDLDMVSGDVIEFEQGYFMKGHTGFTGAYTAATGAASRGANEWGKVDLAFQWMLDGGSWNGTWLDVRTPANLTGITGNIEGGIKFKFRFTATGTQGSMSMLLINSTTTLAAQSDNLYAIDQDTVTLQIKATKADGSPIVGARVYVTKDVGGAVVLEGLTNASGIVEDTAYIYSSDEAISGYVRYSSDSPYYKQGNVTGTITSSGVLMTAVLISDE